MGMNDSYWTGADAFKVGAQEFPLADRLPSMREVAEAMRTLKEYAEAWAMLRKAELSFETGGAAYENAWTNARNLKTALAQADHDLRGLYGGVATYFKDGQSPFAAVPESEYLALASGVLMKLREILMRPKAKPAAVAAVPAEPEPAKV